LTDAMRENHTFKAIERLSESQQYVLGCICMNVDWGHNPRTLATLLRLGLIVEKEQSLPFRGGMRMTVKRCDVASLSVHMAYCYWASLQPESTECEADRV
jgi:hypothetical protein